MFEYIPKKVKSKLVGYVEPTKVLINCTKLGYPRIDGRMWDTTFYKSDIELNIYYAVVDIHEREERTSREPRECLQLDYRRLTEHEFRDSSRGWNANIEQVSHGSGRTATFRIRYERRF